MKEVIKKYAYLIIFLALIGIACLNINVSGTAQNSIDIDNDTQDIILSEINTLNKSNFAQMSEMESDVPTASQIFFYASNPTNVDDINNFITSIGGGMGVNNPYGQMYRGIPLQYIMTSSKTLPDSTPYKLHALITFSLDDQTINRISELVHNPELIKKYRPTLEFGFSQPDSYYLDADFLSNKKPLYLDVTLYRQDINSSWDTYNIQISKLNKFTPVPQQ